MTRRDFEVEGHMIKFVSGSWYLGAFVGPQEDTEAWVAPQVEKWVEGVCSQAKFSAWHPQMEYTGLRMLFQLECQ